MLTESTAMEDPGERGEGYQAGGGLGMTRSVQRRWRPVPRVPRNAPRDVPREARRTRPVPREVPRVVRDVPREAPRDVPREAPRCVGSAARAAERAVRAAGADEKAVDNAGRRGSSGAPDAAVVSSGSSVVELPLLDTVVPFPAR